MHEADEDERRARAARLQAHVAARFSLDGMVDGVLDGYAAALAAKRQILGARPRSG